jgi:amiloride-sensitive sodium channel
MTMISLHSTTHLGSNITLTPEDQRVLAANMQACNPHLSANIVAFCPNATDFNIPHTLAASSPTVNEAFGVCFLRRKAIDCEKIVNRVLTDNGMCYTYNVQNHSVLFNEAAISDDFDSYRQLAVTKTLADDANDDDQSDWSIYDGYRTESEDVFPVRAIRDNVITFYPTVNRSDVPHICLRSGKGFRVYFHAPNEIMTYLHNEYFIPFGFEKQIVLTARHTHYNRDLRVYKAEKRGCYFEGERQLQFFRSYSKAHCLLECFTSFVLDRCGCVKFSMPRGRDTPVCNVSMVRCYTDANSRWPRDDGRERSTAMPCDCFPSCDDITYMFKLDRTGEFESKLRTLSKEWVWTVAFW